MSADTPGNPGGGLSTELLQSPPEIRRDTGLIARAVREKWPIPRAKRKAIVERLMEIVEKREVSIVTKAGDLEQVDGPADVNAISAARVLVAMSGQDRAAEKANPPAAPNVNVQVNIADDGRNRVLEFAERQRTERLSDESAGGRT